MGHHARHAPERCGLLSTSWTTFYPTLQPPLGSQKEHLGFMVGAGSQLLGALVWRELWKVYNTTMLHSMTSETP
jgi:hypothetical protein